jgi:hypothetical protein
MSYFKDFFGTKAAKQKIEELNQVHKQYIEVLDETNTAIERLNTLRKTTSKNVFLKVSAYINLLENASKEFDTAYTQLEQQTKLFNTNADNLNKHYDETNNKINTNSGAGILTGASIAAFAPTAITGAVGVFGTASTGVAISSLSGVAATNATLAYIGGGSLATGGGGIVAGKALLALSGPIGWSIAGACCIFGAKKKIKHNEKVKQQAIDAIKELQLEISYHKSLQSEVYQIIQITKYHSDEISRVLFNDLAATVPASQATFNHSKQDCLQALINNINSFSKLLNKQSEIEK